MDIVIIALLSGVAQLAAHYIPWQRMLRRRLHPTEAYVIGVVLMMMPISVWLILAQDWRVLLALWCVIASSGVMVIGAYGLDAYLQTVEHNRAADAENRMMRESVFDDQNDKRS